MKDSYGARPALLLFLLLLAGLTGCESQAVNLGLRLYPDGSGELEYVAVLPGDLPTADEKRAELFQSLAVRSEVGLRILLLRADFSGDKGLDLGGLRLELQEEEAGAYRARLRIATTADAAWYRALVVGPEELAAFERLSSAQRLMADVPSISDLHVLIGLRMPGEISSSVLDGASWKIEEHAPGSDQTSVMIPVRDLLEAKTEAVTWTVRSGPITAENQEAWTDALHRSADLPEVDRACEETLRRLGLALRKRPAAGYPESGAALLRELNEDARCSTGAAYRVAQDPRRAGVILCDEPGCHPGGIHVLTRKREVRWLREGAQSYAAALQETVPAASLRPEQEEPVR